MKFKTVLLALSFLSVLSCGSPAKEPFHNPDDIWQCVFGGVPRVFVCTNQLTQQRRILRPEAPETSGYQCFPPRDYIIIQRQMGVLNWQASQCEAKP